MFLTLARPFQLAASKAADTPVHLATAPSLTEVSGGYFSKRRPATPSPLALDPTAAARLWDLSTDLVTATP